MLVQSVISVFLLSQGEPTVADRIDVAVEVVAPAHENVQFADLPPRIASLWVIRVSKDAARLTADAIARHRLRVRLEADHPGEYRLDPFEAKVGDRVVRSEPLVVRFRSLLPPTPAGLRPNAPAVPASTNWLPWAVGGAFLILGGASYALFRKRRDPPPFEHPEFAVRRELAAASTAAEIVRAFGRYLAVSFGVDSSPGTTRELLTELDATGHLAPDQLETLRDFLHECDRIRFGSDENREESLRTLKPAAQNLIARLAPSVAAAKAVPEFRSV